jgi:hypothetical protein
MLSVLNGSLVSYLPHRFNVPASRGRNAFPGSRKVIDAMRAGQCRSGGEYPLDRYAVRHQGSAVQGLRGAGEGVINPSGNFDLIIVKQNLTIIETEVRKARIFATTAMRHALFASRVMSVLQASVAFLSSMHRPGG